MPVYAGLTIMLLSVLFLSTFAAGGSPYLVALGMLGVGTGFALTNSPNVNAAAAALPPEETGVGLGIFNGLFFLGRRDRPCGRRGVPRGAQRGRCRSDRPLYQLGAAPFSDAFLLLSVALLLALAAALWLPERQ